MDALDRQVRHCPEATVHQRWTGDTGPDSQPLSEISQVLANPRAARYHVAQSQFCLGIETPLATKGGLAVFKSLAELSTDFKGPFVIDSSVHGPSYLVFQTLFMKDLVDETVETWTLDSTGRHGFVTDGDHSFFNMGVLLITCSFSTIIQSWAPVLYTWILQQDIEHHCPHFHHISKRIVERIQENRLEFRLEFFLHVSLYKYCLESTHISFQVMDFLASQQAAHAEEYADAKILLNPDFYSLTKASQLIE